MPSYIGFDSKDLRRPSSDPSKGYFSPIGASVETFDLLKFNYAYEEAMKTTLEKFDVERKRKIYYFQYFCKLFESRETACEIGNFFLRRLKKHIINANIYFTNIPPSKIPQIYMYGMDTRKETVPTKNFLSTLTNPFPYICAWKYTQKVDANSLLLLDHFQGHQTISWSVFWYRKPIMYYRGDHCNSLISTADILAGTMDESLSSDLNIREMRKILREEIGLRGEVYLIGSPDLRWIVPISRKPINTIRFVRHPIFFIISEKRPSQLDYKEAKDQLEFSPIFDIVTTKAFESNGCVKLYDVTEDYKILKENDRLIYYGERGEELAKNLKSQYGLKYVFDFRIEKDKIE